MAVGAVSTRRLRRLTGAMAAVAVVAPVLALLVLHLLGGAWYVVETPSMGTALPVGTLVITAPVGPQALRVGDVVTYAPPGSTETITHRVVAAGPTGVRTRGDVNGGDDPWILTADEIHGRAVAALPGVGWLLRALPVLLGGFVLILVVGAAVKDPSARLAGRLVAASGAVCTAVLVLRPLVNAAVLTVVAEPGATDVRVVGTGLLPVRIAAHGHAVDLLSGEVGVLHLPGGTTGRIDLTTSLLLAPWGWATFAAVCSLPLLISMTRSVGRASP